ncbi:MAG: substrate-binding periplasmic protein, partial [Thermodesulfobacteriota bacterium]
MKKFFEILAVVFASLLIFNGLSFAMSAEELNYYTEDYPPYNYEKDGKLTGISVETLKLVWEEMGVSPQEIELVPWARGYNKLKKSEGTCLFATTRTPAREDLFKWACPVAKGSRNVLIAKKDRNISIDSIEDANQYKVGAIRDDVAEQLFLSEGGNS